MRSQERTPGSSSSDWNVRALGSRRNGTPGTTGMPHKSRGEERCPTKLIDRHGRGAILPPRPQLRNAEKIIIIRLLIGLERSGMSLTPRKGPARRCTVMKTSRSTSSSLLRRPFDGPSHTRTKARGPQGMPRSALTIESVAVRPRLRSPRSISPADQGAGQQWVSKDSSVGSVFARHRTRALHSRSTWARITENSHTGSVQLINAIG